MPGEKGKPMELFISQLNEVMKLVQTFRKIPYAAFLLVVTVMGAAGEGKAAATKGFYAPNGTLGL